jgi:hypothetical protein
MVSSTYGCTARPPARTYEKSTPPAKSRAPQRESDGFWNDPLLPGRYRFWSTCSHTKRSVSGELLR